MHIPISSLEGYVRQLFWREYVRYVYIYEDANLKKSNNFKHERTLGKKWFTKKVETGIPIIDSLVLKLWNYGYLHHIERLMFIGNFFLLTEIHPLQVYDWFMMFIDAYPWVMSPNVFGMSQYASKIMMTRPYFSSSNYIIKMSSAKKKYGELVLDKYIWTEILDALYYNFINNNYDSLRNNYATARATYQLDKKIGVEKLFKIAKKYMDKY